jgi:hypothetical protein
MAASVVTIDDLQETITGKSLRAEVYSASAQPSELLVAQRPTWLNTAASSLAAFVELPRNWNSYGARKISFATVRDALQLLARLWDLGLPAPRIVPTAQGGVQFEWDVAGVELELELEPGGGMLAVFDDSDRAESWERELPPSDLLPVGAALRRIAQAGRHG